MNKFHGEFPGLHDVPGLAGDELGAVEQLVLLQLQAHQPQGHPGGIDGGLEGPQDVGQGADVVLVPVGEEDAPDLILVLDEVAHVRDDHVHAVHVVVGEAHAHVYDDDIVVILVDGEILADLVESAQGDDFQFFCHNNSFFSVCPGGKPQSFLQLGAQRQGEPLDAPDRPVPRWVLSGFPWFVTAW